MLQDEGIVLFKCQRLSPSRHYFERPAVKMSVSFPALSSLSTDELIKKITEAGIHIDEEEARKFRGK